MDVKKLFRRSKTPEGRSRRNRLSLGAQSTAGSDARDPEPNDGHQSATSDVLPGATSSSSDLNPSQHFDSVDSNAPPVPKVPGGLQSDSLDSRAESLPIAARYTSKAYYQLPTSPPAPFFGISVRRSNTVSTRDSNGSVIIPGRYDHERARRTASLQHPADRPIIVDDTVALGTRKAPNFVEKKTARTGSTPPQTPVSPRPGLSQHPVSPQDYSMSRHQRNLTQDTTEVGAFEDAAEQLPARTPLLESDTVPGFLTPGGSAAQTPAIERIINHREAIDSDSSQLGGADGTRPLSMPSKASNQNGDAVIGSARPPNLEGIVDLRNTVDTDVSTQWADPVVHETVQPKVEHVTHEVYDRDIHHHHIQHRLLPIQEVQQLPPRHFVPHGPNGELIEVDESQVPGRTGANASWAVQQTTPHRGAGTLGQHGQGEEQYASRYLNQEGVPTTEQVWKHPPRVSDGTPDNTGDWPLSNEHGSIGAGEAVANTMASKLPHEQQAERTVESQRRTNRANSGQQPGPGTASAKDLAYRTKPVTQREHEAEATIAAVRAAAKHR